MAPSKSRVKIAAGSGSTNSLSRGDMDKDNGGNNGAKDEQPNGYRGRALREFGGRRRKRIQTIFDTEMNEEYVKAILEGVKKCGIVFPPPPVIIARPRPADKAPSSSAGKGPSSAPSQKIGTSAADNDANEVEFVDDVCRQKWLPQLIDAKIEQTEENGSGRGELVLIGEETAAVSGEQPIKLEVEADTADLAVPTLNLKRRKRKIKREIEENQTEN